MRVAPLRTTVSDVLLGGNLFPFVLTVRPGERYINWNQSMVRYDAKIAEGDLIDNESTNG